MLFNSYTFFIFLAIVYVLYRLLKHRGQNYMLLAASYVFYGFWSVPFCSLLVISTCVDFFCGRAIYNSDDNRRRKILVTASICANLGLLGVFKYFDFFATSLMDFFGVFGLNVSLPLLQVVLPVGISFYTFQTMTYSIDIYRREIKPVDSIFDFALFVAFFPQLVAGPIERAKNLLPQLTSKRVINLQQTREGLWLILVGLFKKAVVADNVALIADNVFNNPTSFSGIYVLVAIYAFAIQVYCDFSGYSDIARGTAKLFGIDIMLNFLQPYFAINPQDIWRRWHISLSTWLRDYLYIPLGGNRNNRLFRNLLITMVLCGLWHGAAMKYIAFGAYHALLMIIYRRHRPLWQWIGDRFGRFQGAWTAVRVVFTFHLWCAGLILFRVNKLADVLDVVPNLFAYQALASPEAKHVLLLMFMAVPIFIVQLARELRGGRDIFDSAPFWVRANLAIYLVLMLVFWTSHNQAPFIYFQF